MQQDRMASLVERIKAFAEGNISARYQSRFGTSDVGQEAALQLLRMAGNDSDSLNKLNSAWLRRAAAGHTKTLLERHSAKKRSVDIETSNSGKHVNTIATPDELASHNEMTIRLAIAIQTLDTNERMVIDRYYARGNSLNEIAKEMKLPAHKIREVYHSALKNLRSIVA